MNRNASFGPLVIIPGLASGGGYGIFHDHTRRRNSPNLAGARSANHCAPSGPEVMPSGDDATDGIGNSVTSLAVVIRPILFAPTSLNQSVPSEPDAMQLAEINSVELLKADTR
jgi:hypothetical protein